jgi:tetratricopeptide (TPR) repeat protein
MGPAQQREDFEILSTPSQPSASPGTVSAKFNYPQSEETVELYKKAAAAEKAGNLNEAVKFVKEVVQVDPANFIAWAKLGSLYLDQKSYSDANTALRKSLELKVEYTPAWIMIGQLRVAQKQYEAAVEIFKHAAALEPESAWTFQLLGEAYLQAKQGTLGAQALNHAIRLDPMGMAEVHLQLAHLFQLAKANKMAADEYRKFLEKRPDHPDRKKFEKFIRENSH